MASLTPEERTHLEKQREEGTISQEDFIRLLQEEAPWGSREQALRVFRGGYAQEQANKAAEPGEIRLV